MNKVRQTETTFIYVLLSPEGDPTRREEEPCRAPVDVNDPSTWHGRVRYVGCSTEPFKRAEDHIGDKRTNAHKARWIGCIQREGLRPMVGIVEECQNEVWRARERHWEIVFRERGEPLTNIAECGQGRPHAPDYKPSPETLVKLRQIASQKAKRYDGFVNPSGEAVTITNMSACCREHGLTASCMRRVYTGKLGQHHGWTCNRPEAIIQREAMKEEAVRTRHEWGVQFGKMRLRPCDGLVDPDGVAVGTIADLTEFCSKRGISAQQIRRVHRGDRKSYKGWTCRRSEDQP